MTINHAEAQQMHEHIGYVLTELSAQPETNGSLIAALRRAREIAALIVSDTWDDSSGDTATGALWISWTADQTDDCGEARWGALTDSRIDGALLALSRALGREPDTVL